MRSKHRHTSEKKNKKNREKRFMVVPLHLQFIILLCDGCFVVILFVGLCGIENRGKMGGKKKPKRRKTTTNNGW